MQAQEFISDTKTRIYLSQPCADVSEFFGHYGVHNLPVVDASDDTYQGLLSEEYASFHCSKDLRVEQVKASLAPHAVLAANLLVEAFYCAYENQLDLVPVVSLENKYLGFISGKQLLQSLDCLLPLSEERSYIVLEMSSVDYSLTQIANIVEENNSKIIHLNVNPNQIHPQLMRVHLTLNTSNTAPLIQAFERYNYHVVVSDKKRNLEKEQDLRERYDLFLKYLNT